MIEFALNVQVYNASDCQIFNALDLEILLVFYYVQWFLVGFEQLEAPVAGQGLGTRVLEYWFYCF